MLTMEQLKTEIRRYKKQKALWEQDSSNWSSSFKAEELANKITFLENQLYELEFAELEAKENDNNFQG